MPESPLPGNLFRLPDAPCDEELFEPLVKDSRARIERIVSTGQSTPSSEWYDQESDEWVVLLQGEAELAFDDGGRHVMNAGDYLFIAAHRRHRVERTSAEPACIWLAVHLYPRSSES